MSGVGTWLETARSMLDAMEATQLPAIDDAAEIFADSIAGDGLVHVFGSGHSRMGAEEMFPRIGSFPGFHPIVELSLTSYHGVVGPNGLRQALFLEKVEGFGRVILEQLKLHRGDAFLILSSTGINGVVIDLALLARQMGLPVVAVTSLDHGHATATRHSSGHKLMDVADVVIDNCSPAGDAVVDVPGTPHKVGPTSSIGAIAVINLLKVATAEKLAARGVDPVVLPSPHFVGDEAGAQQLERVYEEHFRRIGRVYDPRDAIPLPSPEQPT